MMMNIEQIREMLASLKQLNQTLARIEALISLCVVPPSATHGKQRDGSSCDGGGGVYI